jgi:hypothetical protein
MAPTEETKKLETIQQIQQIFQDCRLCVDDAGEKYYTSRK